MSTPEFTPEELRRSQFAVTIDLEYEPCSITAAQLAGDIKDSLRLISKIYTEGGLGRLKPEEHMRVTVADASSGDIREQEIVFKDPGYGEGQAGAFVLARIAQEGSRSVSRRTQGFLKKSPDQETVRKLGDHWVGAYFMGTGLIFPFATLDTRPDGNCKYVQIGPEINDDSVFAVQADETTDRLKIIEDLRAVLRLNDHNVGADDRHRAQKRLYELLYSQLAANANLTTTAVGQLVYRKLSDVADETGFIKTLKSIITVGEKNQHYDMVREIDTSPEGIVTPPESDLDHSTRLALYEIQGEDAMDRRFLFGATRRGNIVLPIAEILDSNGQVLFNDDLNLTEFSQLQNLIALTYRFLGRSVMPDIDEQQRVAAHMLGDVSYAVRPDEFIYRNLDIDKKLDDIIGEVECRHREELAETIGGLLTNKVYAGTAENMHTTKSDGITVRGAVSVERTGDEFQLKLFARPFMLDPIREDQDTQEIPPLVASFEYTPTEILPESFPSGVDAKVWNDFIRGILSQ